MASQLNGISFKCFSRSEKLSIINISGNGINIRFNFIFNLYFTFFIENLTHLFHTVFIVLNFIFKG